MFFFNGTRFVVPTALATGILLAPAGGNTATENPGKLSYGSRMGMTVTIVAKEGIGTANAVIRIKHTPEDAKVFCVEYLRDHSMRCVRDVIATTKLSDRVTGNCVERTWTDTRGSTYSFHGSARQSPELMEDGSFSESDYLIRRDGDERFLPTSPSSYYEALEVFQALCPGIVKVVP